MLKLRRKMLAGALCATLACGGLAGVAYAVEGVDAFGETTHQVVDGVSDEEDLSNDEELINGNADNEDSGSQTNPDDSPANKDEPNDFEETTDDGKSRTIEVEQPQAEQQEETQQQVDQRQEGQSQVEQQQEEVTEEDFLGDWQPPVIDGSSMAGHEGNSWRFQDGQLVPPSDTPDVVLLKTRSLSASSNRRGVDVSEWNGHIDWSKVKKDNIKFAILRCGGTFWGSKKQYNDDEFIYNAQQCERLGIPYGVYFFSTAENVFQAWQEANFTIERLRGRKVSLPVFYDLEWDGVGSTSNRHLLASMSKVFCNAVEAAGFRAGVYASTSWWDYYLTDGCFERWTRWVAQYYSRCEYEGTYRLWQFTSSASVSGIGGGVDLNYDYQNGSQDREVTGNGSNPLRGMICPDPPSALKVSASTPTVSYRAHVEGTGWQGTKSNGSTAGTSGKCLRTEAIQIALGGVSGGVRYRSHVEHAGWLDWMSNGVVSGTSDGGFRLEALQVELTGAVANSYDVWYRVHVQDLGWQGWVKNGQTAGTTGRMLRIEALEIRLLPKGQSPSGAPSVSYDAHVQDIGWMKYVENGALAGTSGRSKRLEAMHIKLNGVSGGITYRAHVENLGWQSWQNNGAMAGTTGKILRVEAMQIKLTGAAANSYDVWYRAHVENLGWQGWVKNGQTAGTSGKSLRLEAYQVMVLPKGSSAPR